MGTSGEKKKGLGSARGQIVESGKRKEEMEEILWASALKRGHHKKMTWICFHPPRVGEGM